MGFTVNLENMKELGVAFGILSEEFNSVEATIDEYEASAGSARVFDRLNEFSENWSRDREEIAEQLQELSETALNVAQTYEDADKGTAGQIDSGR